jgi:hypothetical protein
MVDAAADRVPERVAVVMTAGVVIFGRPERHRKANIPRMPRCDSAMRKRDIICRAATGTIPTE